MRGMLSSRSGEAVQHCLVLLVEDHDGDAEYARMRLSEVSSVRLFVEHARTMAEAVFMLEQGSPIDVIILDLHLPDAQGADAVGEIRRRQPSIPVVVVTGMLDESLRAAALIAGAEEVFSKEDVSSRAFWRAVVRAVERRDDPSKQLQTVLDTTPDAILVVNRRGLVRYVNQAAVDLLGRSRAELLGDPVGFSMRDAQTTEIVIHRGGAEIIGEIRVVPLMWASEPSYLATIRDVTEQRRAEALRQRSDDLEAENFRIMAATKLKSEFLANMSHELRTPLNAIIGFAHLLKGGTVHPESTKFSLFLGHILSSGEHLLQLINDILDLAKVEAGKITFTPQTFDALAVAQDVAAILQPLAMRKSITVSVVGQPLEVYLDPGRFKQVLYNFLSNAIKFTSEGGTVEVRVSCPGGDYFYVEVEDSGIGIAPGDLSRLFKQFEQLESGASKKHQGTGLGLALTKQLVELQSGSVRVTSRLGVGSVFAADLPLRYRPSEESSP